MKRIAIIFFAAAMIAGSALAQGFNDYNDQQNYGYGGGFQDDGSSQALITPVKKALRMRDDTIVILRGNLVRRISDEKYLFHDATGEIIVEIDDDKWGGVTASPKDTLELSGEIDRDINKVKVDVYLVRKVSGAAPQQGFQEN